MKTRENNPIPPFNKGYYLTDGGLETTLIFHYDIELPYFAAFPLVTHPEGRNALSKYYLPYLHVAQQHGWNFILETPTWRASTDWGLKLNYNQQQLNEINRKAVELVQELKSLGTNGQTQMLISGNIGPRGDGYKAEHLMSPQEAKQYHQPQVNVFAAEKVDVVSAMTITYSNEAIGIVQAAAEVGVPVVISFTVETDGRLPSGETLQEAIEKTDFATDAYTTHYMINCAHPQHFVHVLTEAGDWKNRIRGIRANASTKSHAELDESDTLDAGDKHLLTTGYAQLQKLLPNLNVIGGCCGTDHSHIEQVCEHFAERTSI